MDAAETRPEILLTPGPLTTSARTRAAMQRDWGSRDAAFIQLTARVRERLLALAAAEHTHIAVPIQGSGTFAVEAMLQTLVPRTGRLLVLVNGAYGWRMVEIARRLARDLIVLERADDRPIVPAQVAAALAHDPLISDVALVHCETTTGLANPAAAIADIVADAGRRFLLDAMSAFGALPVEAVARRGGSIAASANKCLEGVPGAAFVLAPRDWLTLSQGNAQSLSLDLHAQWHGFETNGQWRFTPPTHVMAALDAALDQLADEGGAAARLARYRRNCAALVSGMHRLGFEPYLDDAAQAPIIVTFREPDGGWFDFEHFYRALHEAGVVIYPGKITADRTFRIGCIGAIDITDIRRALDAIGAYVGRHAPLSPAVSTGTAAPGTP